MRRLYHKLFNMSVNTAGYRLMTLFLLFYEQPCTGELQRGFGTKCPNKWTVSKIGQCVSPGG